MRTLNFPLLLSIMGPIKDADERRRFRFWNTAPVNPLVEAKKSGTPYLGRGQDLMPDHPMPVGEHVGKIMRQVPHAYLRWVQAQPWAADWRPWQPVAGYLSRFPLPEKSAAGPAAPPVVIYVDPLTACVPNPRWRWPQVSHLHCLPGFEDYLHAFAVGALGLDRRWYQTHGVDMPHYDLTEAKQTLACGLGAELIDRRQTVAHIRAWRESWGRVEAPEPAAGTEFVREMPDGSARCTKHCYADKKEADTKINELTTGRRHHRRHRPDYLRSYYCGRCGFWHLTSKPLRGHDDPSREF